jgi:hypothetical protein
LLLVLPQVGLEGIGAAVDTVLGPRVVDLRCAPLLRGHAAQASMMLHNLSTAPAIFEFSGMTDDVELSPESGVVPPGGSSTANKTYFQPIIGEI